MIDQFWISRIRDNRMRGLIAEMSEAISDCADPDLLRAIKGTLRIGLANHAALREDAIRNAQPTRKNAHR